MQPESALAGIMFVSCQDLFTMPNIWPNMSVVSLAIWVYSKETVNLLNPCSFCPGMESTGKGVTPKLITKKIQTNSKYMTLVMPFRVLSSQRSNQAPHLRRDRHPQSAKGQALAFWDGDGWLGRGWPGVHGERVRPTGPIHRWSWCSLEGFFTTNATGYSH